MAHINLTLKDNGSEVALELLEKLGVDPAGIELSSVVIKEGTAGGVLVTYVASISMPRAHFQPYLELFVAADSHGRALLPKGAK